MYYIYSRIFLAILQPGNTHTRTFYVYVYAIVYVFVCYVYVRLCYIIFSYFLALQPGKNIFRKNNFQKNNFRKNCFFRVFSKNYLFSGVIKSKTMITALNSLSSFPPKKNGNFFLSKFPTFFFCVGKEDCRNGLYLILHQS